jgi:anti-sigma factor RsiW
MTCSDFLEAFSDFVDGEAPEDVSQAIRLHMESCAECRRYHDVYQRGVTLLRSFPGVAVTDGFEEDLEVRLRRDTSAALRHLGQRPPQAGATMALVFGMAVILVAVAWSPFLLVSVTRPAQVEMAPIVARSPARRLPVRLPNIDLMPNAARSASMQLPAEANLWGEARNLFREYAPVMQSYQASARSGLD